MGRRPWSNRYTVEECKSLSVLSCPPSEIKALKLLSENFSDFQYETTPCHYGGVRYWFLCSKCKKRVAKLYAPPSSERFACRNCHNLTYESCKTHDARIDAIIKNPQHIAERVKNGGLKDEIFMFKVYDKI